MSKNQPKKTAPRKDLHDGRSLWCDTPHANVRTRGATRELDADIVIVGAGISGSLIALVLTDAGHDVAVIDRRQPGLGSTIASTAMIQFELDTPLIELKKKIGGQKAARAYLRSLRAVGDLKKLLTQHGVDAKWIDRDALYLAGNTLGYRGLKQEAAARKRVGLPSRYLSAAETLERFGVATTGAILSEGAAELDPAAAASGALRAAQALGARVFSPCDVLTVESSPDGVLLQTKLGHEIACRKAIFATGYEVIGSVPRDVFDIVSSWAVATQPIPEKNFWPSRCLIWEAADPYLYMRSTPDNRIVIGGEDSGLTDPERRHSAIANKSQKLIAKARRLLGRPELEIDYAWAGAFAESPTGLPFFREIESLPGVFAVLGCGGNGITFSMIAAQIVKAWAEGKADPDAGLFRGL